MADVGWIEDDVKNVNGVDEIVPATEKTNLGMCFYQSLKNLHLQNKLISITLCLIKKSNRKYTSK